MELRGPAGTGDAHSCSTLPRIIGNDGTGTCSGAPTLSLGLDVPMQMSIQVLRVLSCLLIQYVSPATEEEIRHIAR